jgi:hypothetical protein
MAYARWLLLGTHIGECAFRVLGSDCSTEEGPSTYAIRRIFVCQVATFADAGVKMGLGHRDGAVRRTGATSRVPRPDYPAPVVA